MEAVLTLDDTGVVGVWGVAGVPGELSVLAGNLLLSRLLFRRAETVDRTSPCNQSFKL